MIGGAVLKGIAAYARVLATRLGMAAVDSVVEGYWGTMVALKGTDIQHVGFQEALGQLKTTSPTGARTKQLSSSDSRWYGR